ncbi:MAG: helix-turn-helix domain-containing protein [Oscillospiraceae bacterium]|nr:helix-turn-helix domain-containing protein [Oscillospiraceae bacterium]MDY4105483.1 helix-turn-helix domain-containing protein [Oscillospiraceae bacterium]
MSNRVFQSVINQMKDATDRQVGVVDDQGYVVACNELSMIGTQLSDILEVNGEVTDQVITLPERSYRLLGTTGSRFEFAVFVKGNDQLSVSLCIVMGVAMNEAKINYDEKYNKATFVKNIISDNILPGDVYARAKDLRFVTDIPRAVMVVQQVDRTDVMVLDVIQRLFPDKQSDFVFSVSETDIVVIKELSTAEDPAEIEDLARQIENAVRSELMVKVIIGIGTVAGHLRELADRYKEAQVAIEVGKIFEPEKSIIRYENLGIGRIIYQLPTTLCEMFLSEVFKKNPIESLDADTMDTINKFFENNLNVSETSRKLYVHRNTLVYRLEKIKKLTGLDLREFDHAIVFKVAMMVNRYLEYQKEK